jgi:subtilisin family serine protease
MTKKFLSVFLSAVMVLLMIPAGVIETSAEQSKAIIASLASAFSAAVTDLQADKNTGNDSINPFAASDAERTNRLSEIQDNYVENTSAAADKTVSAKTENVTGERFLVKFKDDVTYSEIETLLAPYQYKVIGDSSHKLFSIAAMSIESLKSDFTGKYDYIENNGVSKAAMVADDPLSSEQWALNAVNIPNAWDISTGSANVLVAVIDTGIYRSHEDFNYANIRSGWDYVNGTTVTGDSVGHGTMVTGIIAAATNNSKGISGVCWNVTILPFQVFDTDGYAYDDDVCSAIYDAADAGADVINMSLGSDYYSASIDEAVAYAVSKGCILVAAAGNDSNGSYSYPASCDGVVSVASVNNCLVRSSFSNYNSLVDVAAPGEYVLTTVKTSSASYDHVDGTSFSSPYVAGIAALVKAQDDSIGPHRFLGILRNTSTDEGVAGRDDYYGYGLVNAGSVLTFAAANIGNDFIIKNGILTDYIGDSVNVTIPAGVNGIADNAFFGLKYIRSISIPDGVTTIGANAFKGCTGLTSITIPKSVTTIGDEAFTDNPWLQTFAGDFVIVGNDILVLYKGSNADVVIPDGVKSIGYKAFCNQSNITSVVLPYSVQKIGNYAFYTCGSLAGITIPEGVKELGDHTFVGCYKLKSITIPSTVTAIGDYTFNACSGLQNIIIPDSVTSIGAYAFGQCNGLKSIEIPDSVSSIAGWAFEDCSALNNITIPDSITVINEGTFVNCSFLTNIILPSNLKSLGKQTFQGCCSLAGITIPASVTSIGDQAFYNCSKLNGLTLPDSLISLGTEVFYNCIRLNGIKIPNTITSISDGLFFGCNGLTGITINNNMTSIGIGAFRGCTGLTSITFPTSIKSIMSAAFYGCTGITNITIPGSVKSIGDSAFDSCSNLRYAYFLGDAPTLGSSVFASCFTGFIVYYNNGKLGFTKSWYGYQTIIYGTDFQYSTGNNATTITKYVGVGGSVSVPSVLGGYPVTSIQSNAFSSCVSVTSVNIPNSVTSIGNYAFSGCSGMKAVDLPNSLTSIQAYAFYNCTSLTSITFPNSMKNIGAYVFMGCTNLTDFVSTDSITSIGIQTFYGCTKLANITLSNNLTSIGTDAFYGCASLRSITIPRSMTIIGESAFRSCTGLTSVSIPNSVTQINNFAFQECNLLTSVIIPNSVTHIGSWAFWGCYNLITITIPSSVNSIYGAAFSGCSKVTIYCSAGSYAETIAKADGIPYDSINIISANGTNTVINKQKLFIYGLTPSASSLDGIVEVTGGATLQTSNTGGSSLGTGTIVNVMINGGIIETYKIIIFGDVNGDGNIDSIDAGKIVDIQNYMTSWDPVADAAFYKAADVNGDGNIDSIDAGLLVDSQNYMAQIDQTTGLAG